MESGERNGTTAPTDAAVDGERPGRYLVTVTREVVAYALSDEEAKARALHYLRSTSLEQPADRPWKVTSVSELPAVEDEERAEVIDRAPSRETRA